MQTRNVTVIPPSSSVMVNSFDDLYEKIPVCAYARVSTSDEDQLTSYEAQKYYYTEYIKSNPRWQFVKVYTDKGITGTNLRRRDGFNEMIADAYAGKIKLILTKSVSRFARNTLDAIQKTRELKRIGVGVIFENDKIDSRDPSAELNLTIRASIAQEESRSTSDNVTKGKRWRFKKGKVSINYKRFLGFTKDKINDCYVIVPEEAAIVRRIYEMFLYDGHSCNYIAKTFNIEGVRTASGEGKWSKNTIESILRNEKYMGDALLQKTYTPDFLEHKSVKNDRAVAQYYHENVLPAIIDKEMWYQVQAELDRREKLGAGYSSLNDFASKVICSDCGGIYGQKLWHSTDKFKRYIYRCNEKYEKDIPCNTPSVTEDELKAKFLVAYHELMKEKDRVILDLRNKVDKALVEAENYSQDIIYYEERVKKITEDTKILINKYCFSPEIKEEYARKYNQYKSEHDYLRTKLEEAEQCKFKNLCKSYRWNGFIKTIEHLDDMLSRWQKKYWMLLIEYAMVYENGQIVFRFYSGDEIII